MKKMKTDLLLMFRGLGSLCVCLLSQPPDTVDVSKTLESLDVDWCWIGFV